MEKITPTRNTPKCDLKQIGDVGATAEEMFDAMAKLLQTPRLQNSAPKGVVWKM